MKTKDLFRMEYAQILIYIVFLGLLEVLLFIFEVNYFLMIYLLLIGLILEGVYLCQRYMKKYRYYKKVKAKLDILEQKCMITEMLELPDFAEGEFLYEILQTCNKSMNDEILKYKIEAAGYREYIEMWIHEVKTPLAATRLILENHPSEITRAMDEEMQQINYYLEQALYYARSNSVEKDYLVKELSLKEVVENAVKANAKSLIGNKIKIKIENLDQKIFSDEKWVLFILNQVISNAIKYKKEEADRLLLLGDILYHGPRNDLPKDYNCKKVIALLNPLKKDIIAVRGNCDSEVDQMVLDFPMRSDYALMDVDQHHFFMTHGHLFNEDQLPLLNENDILIYGHFHKPLAKKENGIYILNPSSISLPKEGNNSYGIYESNEFLIKEFSGQVVKAIKFD